MADEAYTPIPDEEEPLIQTRPRTRRIRYAVGAASLMLAAAARARATRRDATAESSSRSASAPRLSPRTSIRRYAPRPTPSSAPTSAASMSARPSAPTPATRALGAVCALAAFANLDTVCAAMGYCAGEVVDDVQAWFAPTWKGYLETALTIKADFEPPWPDWGSGDDDTAMACDLYAWCTVCAGADSCADVESVAATAMHDPQAPENSRASRGTPRAAAHARGAAMRHARLSP